MILGIGVDIIRIERFKSWEKYKVEQLLKIFSLREIESCVKKNGEIELQCLASRFSSKEAFFKALSATLVNLGYIKNNFSFLFSCKNVEIIKPVWGVPQLNIDWKIFENKIENKLPRLNNFLSLSHEKDYAISYVIISN
ncbi:4'-phosphopantetheinyl transferase superfamily protein [Candidatus Dependentiae bacterium]|nr:4'-phosphopantetheinyl transferase superfamily protein [Candidatus Dependentiae bacterium]